MSGALARQIVTVSVAAGILDRMRDKDLRQSLRIFGIATRAELLASGLSRDQVATAVRRGELLRAGCGVYARQDVVEGYLHLAGGEHVMRAAAAVAAMRGAVLSHESAAQLHGIDLLESRGAQVTVTCRPEHGRRGPAGIKVHTAVLPPDHVGSARLGLPMTTPARTVVDLSRQLEFRAGVVAADSALHRKLTTKAELQSVLAACSQRRGIERAIGVAEFADGRAESPLESIARVAFRDFGLPPPQLQVWLGGTVEPVGRVDFYWPHYRTIAEVDGAAKYEDPMRAKAQLRRDKFLREEGFEVVHFDWQEVTQTPQAVAAAIRAAFRRGRVSAAAPRAAG
jgi:predicted transcriptional regulator of viral defense system